MSDAQDLGSAGTRMLAALRLNMESSMRTLLARRRIGGDGDDLRDLDEECRYPQTEELSAENYRDAWDRWDIAERVCSIYPEECWKNAPWVYENEEPDETPFEEAWLDLVDFPNNVLAWLELADILSGIGRFGCLLIGINDSDDLSKPISGVNEYGSWITPQERRAVASKRRKREAANKKEKAVARDAQMRGERPNVNPRPKPAELPAEGEKPMRELLYLRVFDETLAKVASYDGNPKSPRYGQPEFYELTMGEYDVSSTDGGDGAKTKTTRVHWTRVLHLKDGRTTSVIFGKPRMQAVWNRLLDLRKINGSSAEMFYRGGFPGLAFEMDPDAEGLAGLDDEERKKIKEQYDLYANRLQRFLAVEGLTVKELSPQVADPGPTADLQIRMIASTLGVPWRIFLGSEAAQLASEQDTNAWNERVNARQRKYLTPCVLRPFVDRLIAAGVLPKPEEDYQTEWDDLNTQSDSEKATVAKLKTEALNLYASGSIRADVPFRMFLLHFMQLELDIIDEIIDAAELEKDRINDEQAEALANQDPEATDGLFPAKAGDKPPVPGLKVATPIPVVKPVVAPPK